jgi:D-glycero-D-manno-heptose 1,7-bisphosphate phosphatase
VTVALFLDRDGTVIADAHYLADPSGVRLIAGAADAVRWANAQQVPVFLITNQSGIARGLITPAQYEATRERTEALLAEAGAAIVQTYHCPHLPDPARPCPCRKPGLGMYQQAAAEHGLDLARAAYIGDRWRDVQPAIATGGVGVLVPGVETPVDDVEQARSALSSRLHVADSLGDAVRWALAALGMTQPIHSNSEPS